MLLETNVTILHNIYNLSIYQTRLLQDRDSVYVVFIVVSVYHRYCFKHPIRRLVQTNFYKHDLKMLAILDPVIGTYNKYSSYSSLGTVIKQEDTDVYSEHGTTINQNEKSSEFR